ncbi:MAG TPA: hypothetical protein IGS31_13220 [Oscillatoriales cyanobacterium M4454_W2019_049]|nr:MAG: hypothetical protein CUN57_00010 [Phototrophicales bacterium]HIK32287.1 hypothetical protein [Oscillatoriales cyanobacterium M4454_W2019_049]
MAQFINNLEGTQIIFEGFEILPGNHEIHLDGDVQIPVNITLAGILGAEAAVNLNVNAHGNYQMINNPDNPGFFVNALVYTFDFNQINQQNLHLGIANADGQPQQGRVYAPM